MSLQRRTATLCDHRGPECLRELVTIGGDHAAAAAARRAGWVREPHGDQNDVCPVCQSTAQPWRKPPRGVLQLIAAPTLGRAAYVADLMGLQRHEWRLLDGPHDLVGRTTVHVVLVPGYAELPLWTDIRTHLRIVQHTGRVVWAVARA